MNLSSLKSLAALPDYGPLVLLVLLHGTAISFAMPYITLFATDAVHMQPLALGAFMTALAVSGIVASAQLGKLSDRLTNRRPVVLITLAAAVVGWALLAVVRSFWPVMLITVVLLGTGAAAFPQIFALAKARIAGEGRDAAENGLTTLRSVFSLAWVVGPAGGAVALANFGFRGLFLAASACFLLALLPAARVRPPGKLGSRVRQAGLPRDPEPLDRKTWLVALGFVLYGMANSMGAIALPLYVTGSLHLPQSNVGLLVGACALFEIPVMLSFVLTPRRLPNERLITFAFGLFAIYALMVVLAPSLGVLLLAQVVRAVVIAIAACLGMAYFQDLMPDHVGTATALFANTTSVGQVAAGIAAGGFAQAFGFHAVFLLCAAAATAACLLLVSVRRARALEQAREAVLATTGD